MGLRLVVGGAQAGGRWGLGWWWGVVKCAVHFVSDIQTECLLSVISVLVKGYRGAIYLDKAYIASG